MCPEIFANREEVSNLIASQYLPISLKFPPGFSPITKKRSRVLDTTPLFDFRFRTGITGAS
jgi:hypothetical protein